ncbi:hypothetical protein U4I66_07775 [Stenotrophomonas maltophilia]|uniref:hypothetical protein n=1 Tax=Stenotrophomonas maltophilia TaxID=40324 RepID=UPI002ACC9367|nr:hypothetical protein [Stenotrophomonas maltophilia]MDZ5841735.1 hypothetical protein [Stenotrophomonas maltophilia]
MNTTMADGAEQRLDAQIAEALFGQPGMSKMDVANLVRELRGDGPALLVPRKAGQNAMVPHARALELVGDAYNAGTHGIGYSQQAMELHDSIISDQPSPGGQGSVRASFKEWAVSEGLSIEHDDGRFHGLETRGAWLAWKHLAARQPVGEPVAWLVHWSDMPLESPEVTRSASRISEVSALTNPPRIVPLYAAPPALAVDLDKLRLLGQRIEQVGRNAAPTAQGSGNVYFRNVIDWGRALLALIDGQAVGNG